jgi:competence protein ComEC
MGSFLSRWWILALTVLAIAGYTILAGAGASVVRAAIMGSLALVGAQLGRRSSGLAGFNTLAFTAAVMSLFNPLLPWDASFQLSFAATLGLMLYAAPLQDGFTRLAARHLPLPLARKIAGPVGEYILFTLAAQITTLPVVLYHFQRLSISALLVNPLVLPAQPLVMILSGLAVIVGMVVEPLGRLLAWVSLPLSGYTIRIIEAFAPLPGGVLLLDRLEPAAAVLMFAAVTLPAFTAGMLGKLPGWVKTWATPAFALTAAGLLAAFLARSALSAPEG